MRWVSWLPSLTSQLPSMTRLSICRIAVVRLNLLSAFFDRNQRWFVLSLPSSDSPAPDEETGFVVGCVFLQVPIAFHHFSSYISHSCFQNPSVVCTFVRLMAGEPVAGCTAGCHVFAAQLGSDLHWNYVVHDVFPLSPMMLCVRGAIGVQPVAMNCNPSPSTSAGLP